MASCGGIRSCPALTVSSLGHGRRLADEVWPWGRHETCAFGSIRCPPMWMRLQHALVSGRPRRSPVMVQPIHTPHEPSRAVCPASPPLLDGRVASQRWWYVSHVPMVRKMGARTPCVGYMSAYEALHMRYHSCWHVRRAAMCASSTHTLRTGTGKIGSRSRSDARHYLCFIYIVRQRFWRCRSSKINSCILAPHAPTCARGIGMGGRNYVP